MKNSSNELTYSLSNADREELNKLVSVLELSDSTTTIFAIAPESEPQHPVVEELKSLLSESEEGFQFQNFFYSDNSLHNFLYGLDEVDRQTDGVRSPQPPFLRGAIEGEGNRLVVMAFGIDQLPTPRLVREMKQLNLGRDSLFKRELVLIFWLNKVEFLDEFRNRAPDFWDWRGKVVQFEARPVFNPLFYPYLEWLIAENSYLKISGVMQVQRQVDIFLDQIYVSLQAVRRQQVTETSERGHRELEMRTSRHVGKGRRGGSALDELELLDEFEPLVPDFVPTAVSTKTVTQKVDLSQAVRENQYCVILGAPGAGKTTLLRYLALHFATAKRDGMELVAGGEGQEELGKPLLPIFFRIADYAERLAQEPDLSLLEYLRQFYRQWEVYFEDEGTSPPAPLLQGEGSSSTDLDLPLHSEEIPPLPPLLKGELEEKAHPDLDPSLHSEGIPPQPPLLRGELELEDGVPFNSRGVEEADIPQLLCEQMRHGQCLMLLDGLDEVFDQESRRLIVERINQFVEEFSANKFVVTSRIAGYRDVKLSERFAEFTIEDMGSEQVEGFLHRWCRAVEQAQQPDANQEQWQRLGDEQAREILAAIQANEGVKRLTANPLLLTILALIHRNGSRLPHRRVELYALAVKTLTEDWQLGKKLPDAPKVVLKESEVVELLAPLAYWMHEEKPSGVVSQAEAEERLAATLAELNDDEPESESVWQAVEQFLRKVRETTGLFVERAPGVYGFMHLTFEEYFAARYIADHERSEILQLIRKHLHEPRWDEPILLALGYYGVHSPRQVNKLVEELFSHLEGYEPEVQGGEIKIKNASSPDAVLIWSVSEGESGNADNQLELRLQDLLFAGEVLAQVEVNSRIRLKLIDKLVLTLVLGTEFEIETNKQILKSLRQIELFNQKGEVIARLKKAVNNSMLSEEQRIKAQSGILYIACGESNAGLVDCVTEIVNQLEPTLFCSIKDLVAELGGEMTPALETTRQNHSGEQESHKVLTFFTAMSYIRTDNYGNAIDILKEINGCSNSSISAYIDWSLATCYQEKKEFDKAIDYYQECFEKLARYIEPSAFMLFWRNRGICHRLHGKYEQALDCFQRMLAIERKIHKLKDEALSLYQIGKTYKEWGKYEQAITHYQQSRDLYDYLGKDKDVASRWYNLADCYREWDKYEQAVECQQQCLTIRQQLEDQSNIASAHWQLGRIYQDWGKYEQAITHYQQSRELYEQLGKETQIAFLLCLLACCYRDWGKYERAVDFHQQALLLFQKQEDQLGIVIYYSLSGSIYKKWGKYEQAIAHYQHSRELYEQLGKEKNVANQWYNLADCYREWDKYEQAVECQQKCLIIRQKLDDQSDVASAYYQLGRIYQSWGKYEQALVQFQQSRELYEQLGKRKEVASQLYKLADCYRDWGKYKEAEECELKDLAIRQQLDDQLNIARAYFQLGWIHQAWGKYEQAIPHFQHSRELYGQLGKRKEVASQWYNLAGCYRDWGKYKEAEECELKSLAIRQQLDDQPGKASAYFHLGRIYRAWSRYEQAIAYYQQSRDLYEQLGRDKNVANLWYWLGDCYRNWGKYEQAVECQQQCLRLRQTIDDQSDVALSYYQLGRIYQAWGKYEQASAYYQQSRDFYEQLGRDKNVANQWYWLGDCYRNWGKYEQAVECELKDLAIRQKLDDQTNIADAYKQLGRIYQAWGKYEQAIAYYQRSYDLYEQLGQEKNVASLWYCLAAGYRNWGKYELAISHYQQSRELYEQLGREKDVANQLSWLASCYRSLKNYTKAIEYDQQSRDLHQQLGEDESVASRCRQITDTQRLLAKNIPDTAEAFNLLIQAEQNIRQAIELNTAGDYKKNLAYDYTALGLLCSERLRLLPSNDSSLPEQIAQFEDYYNTGLTYLTELGQTVDRAEETLDMARAYLEVNTLENLDQAEALAQESLQIFQDYKRRKLEAAARQLLGEIYLKRAQRNQPNDEATAHQFLSESLQIYRELDLTEKAAEVEQLMLFSGE